LSARAAWRLESLGFTQVYRYKPGKSDWFASGLPREGKDADVPQVGDLAQGDIPTCHMTDRTGDIQNRLRAVGWDVCVVINDARVVLGLVRGEALESHSNTPVEQVMESGPTTIRPNWSLEQTTAYMQEQGVEDLLITTPDGTLMGIVYRTDIEHRLGKFTGPTTGG
jgi:predicted transcriptional regulator